MFQFHNKYATNYMKKILTARQDDTFLVDIFKKFVASRETQNHRREIALNNAISNRSYRVYNILTTGSADFRNITELGESMLHYAAVFDK